MSLQTDVAVMKETVALLDQKVDRVLVHLDGNGKPGLLIRVDRLEQSSNVKRRFAWVLLAAIIGAAATAFANKLWAG